MEKTSGKIIGLLFIALGIISIVNHAFHIHLFEMIHLWPLFVLIPGLCFEYGYFSTKRSPGVLVPGGILTVLGCLFMFEANTDFIFAAYTWPVYILAPAVGLFQLYLFGTHSKGLLIPVGILTTIAVVSFANILLGNIFHFIDRSYIAPVVLIIIGCCALFGGKENVESEVNKKKMQ